MTIRFPRVRRLTNRRSTRWMLVLAIAAVGSSPPVAAQPLDTTRTPDLRIFVGSGCPHCARALEWLADLRQRRSDLDVQVFDVVRDPAALMALRELSTMLGLSGVSVPTFVVHDSLVFVGFDEAATTGPQLELLLGGRPGGAPAPPDTAVPPRGGALVTPFSTPTSGLGASVTLPLFGTIALDEVGLPAFTVALGLLDGFNPCAMWVLLFLISMLLHVPDRKRMAMIGGVFVGVSGAVYYAFMAAWLNAFLLLGMARWIQVTLGGVAIALGALNIKDFLWLRRGPSLGIPDAAKPGIYARVRRVVTAERLGAALASAAVLATLVNTVELLCTAGLPALFTRILTLHELSVWTYHAYLVLYDICYMLDDALVLTVAIVTLSQNRLQERGARWLKLLSGGVMIGLGALLLLEPDWLLGG